MSTKTKTILLIALVILLVVPLFVHGQEEGVVLLDNSLPGLESGVVAEGSLGDYLNNLFRIGIGIAAALAVIVVTRGGIEYMLSTSIGSKDAGREKISSALWGFVLALAAFIILNTINPDLIDFKITKAVESIRAQIESQQGPPTVDTGFDWSDEAGNLIRGILEQNTLDPVTGFPRVSINKSECDFVGQVGCTSLSGISPVVYSSGSGLAKLVQDSNNCFIMVTAGTEYWLHGNRSHDINTNNSNHKPGNAVVDINDDECINQYILGGAPSSIQSTADLTCFDKFTVNGVLFQWEAANCPGSTGSHWHVEF